MSQRRNNEAYLAGQIHNSWLRPGANFFTAAAAIAVIGGTQIQSQGHAAQLSANGFTFSGPPPTVVVAPPLGRVIVGAQEQQQSASFLRGPVLEIPESVPVPIENQKAVVARQENVDTQPSWLWRGQVPQDVIAAIAHVGSTSFASQRHADALGAQSTVVGSLLVEQAAPPTDLEIARRAVSSPQELLQPAHLTKGPVLQDVVAQPISGRIIGDVRAHEQPRHVVLGSLAAELGPAMVPGRIIQGGHNLDQPRSVLFAKVREAAPAIPIPIENQRSVALRHENAEVQPSWLWRGQVPADVVPLVDQTGQTTISSQGRPDLNQKRGLVVAGVPPPDVEPPAPVYVPEENRRIIAPRLESRDVQPSWLWRGNVIPERELVYAQLVLARDPEDRWSPVFRSGVPPADVEPPRVPTENKRLIAPRAENANTQPSWLWRGAVPVDVQPPRVPTENKRLIVGRLESRNVQPSWVWRGNVIPDHEIVYAQLITWNDPPPPNSGVQKAGLQPLDYVPPTVPVENKRLIVGRLESRDVQPSTMRLGVMPVDVIPPKPPEEGPHLIVGRLESRDVQPSWLWRGAVPADRPKKRGRTKDPSRWEREQDRKQGEREWKDSLLSFTPGQTAVNYAPRQQPSTATETAPQRPGAQPVERPVAVEGAQEPLTKESPQSGAAMRAQVEASKEAVEPEPQQSETDDMMAAIAVMLIEIMED